MEESIFMPKNTKTFEWKREFGHIPYVCDIEATALMVVKRMRRLPVVVDHGGG